VDDQSVARHPDNEARRLMALGRLGSSKPVRKRVESSKKKNNKDTGGAKPKRQ